VIFLRQIGKEILDPRVVHIRIMLDKVTLGYFLV